MKHEWIKRNGSRHLLMVFLGWGTDTNAIAHIDSTTHDIVALFDYHDISLAAEVNPATYQTIDIVAWSMGVWAAEQFIVSNRLSANVLTAINGTPTPVDAATGIAPDTVAATRDNWSEATRNKFNLRMCGGRSAYAECATKMSQRNVENQCEELTIIMQLAQNTHQHIKWHKAIVGNADLIFLPENQRRYWTQNANEIVETDMPHFPFSTINSWDELI